MLRKSQRLSSPIWKTKSSWVLPSIFNFIIRSFIAASPLVLLISSSAAKTLSSLVYFSERRMFRSSKPMPVLIVTSSNLAAYLFSSSTSLTSLIISIYIIICQIDGACCDNSALINFVSNLPSSLNVLVLKMFHLKCRFIYSEPLVWLITSRARLASSSLLYSNPVWKPLLVTTFMASLIISISIFILHVLPVSLVTSALINFVRVLSSRFNPIKYFFI